MRCWYQIVETLIVLYQKWFHLRTCGCNTLQFNVTTDDTTMCVEHTLANWYCHTTLVQPRVIERQVGCSTQIIGTPSRTKMLLKFKHGYCYYTFVSLFVLTSNKFMNEWMNEWMKEKGCSTQIIGTPSRTTMLLKFKHRYCYYTFVNLFVLTSNKFMNEWMNEWKRHSHLVIKLH